MCFSYLLAPVSGSWLLPPVSGSWLLPPGSYLPSSCFCLLPFLGSLLSLPYHRFLCRCWFSTSPASLCLPTSLCFSYLPSPVTSPIAASRIISCLPGSYFLTITSFDDAFLGVGFLPPTPILDVFPFPVPLRLHFLSPWLLLPAFPTRLSLCYFLSLVSPASLSLGVLYSLGLLAHLTTCWFW